jgi:hypothetical protein
MTYSPHDLLPAPEPKYTDYGPTYFYDNVAKYLIKDTVRIMHNGLHVDLDKVEQLQVTLDNQLESVSNRLASNPHIKGYLDIRHSVLIVKYQEERKTRLRDASYYLKPFKPGDMTHRSYFMHIYATKYGKTEPTGLLPTGIPKWPANLVKKLSKTKPMLKKLLAKEITDSHPIAKEAMELLATHKAELHNRKYLDQIASPDIELPPFNPNSSEQKRELFESLGVQSDVVSKTTGLPSYGRDVIEGIGKMTADPDVKALVDALIDQSYAAIVRNNFINAFYRYTVDDRLYGQYKLLGAKSARYTSSNPNMLNMPSTGSIFAKPIKKCFTAPPGSLICAIDYAALEDRVVANLSRDSNKLGLFLEGLDGHSLSATYYYPARVKDIIGPFTDNKEASKLLKAIVDDKDHPKHKDAVSVRQDSKPISFGLAYGAFPPKVAATVKIPLDEAELIFNAYHNDLFPGITEFRESYVLPTAIENGRIHLGLGFYIYTDDPDRDIRTINNACSQFWSILTALTINRLHALIDEAGLQDDIKVTSTIYDSIYFEVTDDPEIIKWLNDHIIPVMTTDFMENQLVHNDADLEIGKDWANLEVLPHNASIEEIQTIRNSL